MPKFLVSYTGPLEFEIEADNNLEAEMKAYDKVEPGFDFTSEEVDEEGNTVDA